MTSKERMLTAIKHREPDRVPTFANLTPQVAKKLGKKMGLSWEPEICMRSSRTSHTEILLKLGNDAVCITYMPTNDTLPRYQKDGSVINGEFGFVSKKVGFYDEIIKRPLAHAETIRDIDKFKMPDPTAPERWDLPKKKIKHYGKDFAIIGDLEATIFELSWNLVGMEKFLIDLVIEKPYVFALMDKVLEHNLVYCKKMVGLGVDVIWLGDDFGTQKGMMIRPELWRKVFKPRMHYIFKELKRMNPEIKIAYHSCGSIVTIIPDLMEIGIDILNPIQPQANGMNLAELKKKFGDKLVFFGGVDEQRVLPFGNTKDIEEEVKLRIAQAGKGGGFIIAPAHNIQVDTPIENIYAYFRAIKKYGSYPSTTNGIESSPC